MNVQTSSFNKEFQLQNTCDIEVCKVNQYNTLQSNREREIIPNLDFHLSDFIVTYFSLCLFYKDVTFFIAVKTLYKGHRKEGKLLRKRKKEI